MSVIDDYWIKFLKETNITANEICSGDINFGSNGFTNDSQISYLQNIFHLQFCLFLKKI